MQRPGAPAARGVTLCCTCRYLERTLLLDFRSTVAVDPRQHATGTRPPAVTSPPRGAPKLVEACLFPTESAGVALGVTTTNALVVARHMVRNIGFVGIIAQRGHNTITIADIYHMYIAVIPGTNRQCSSNVSCCILVDMDCTVGKWQLHISAWIV